MKKYSTLFIITAFLAITFCGCANDDYSAEKLLYRASKVSKKIFLSPDAAAPFEYRNAISAYQKVIGRFPKSAYAKKAQFTLGELYMLKKEYSESRKELNKLFSMFPEDKEMAAQVQFALGKTFEVEGRWDEALKEYENVKANYPESSQAFQLPFYIAQYYQKQKDFKKADAAYRQAIEKYADIAKNNPEKPIAYIAENMIVLCLSAQEKWPEAVSQLKKMIENYPNITGVLKAVTTLEQVYIQRLKQPEALINYYNQFISEHKDLKLSEILKMRVVKLKEKLKI